MYGVDGSTSGNAVTKYVAGLPPEELSIPGLQNPSAAAFDSQGDLFVANSAANNVLMVTPEGTTTVVGSGYDYPMGVAVNSYGDVVVVDTYADRVTVSPSVDPQSIALTAPIPYVIGPGKTATLAATGGGSGQPVVFSVNPTTYPSDACTISANGRKVTFAKVGRCVIDLDQAGSVHHLSAHRTVQTTIRPPGLASLAVVRPTPSVSSAVALTTRGLDAQGNDLGDVTAITTFTASHASCSRKTCTWDTADPSTIRANVFTARGTQAVTPALGIRLVSGGQSVAAFPATVGSPIDAGIDAIGGSSGSYAFARTSGPLPKGVVLGADGTLSGSPVNAGSYPFTVVVTDTADSRQRATVKTSIVVAPAPPS